VKLANSVRRARPSDAAALAELVNRAYEVEQFFVDGARTTADEIAALARDGMFLVLDHDGGSLAGAVHVDASASGAYIRMLSVLPEHQGNGLGKRLVGIAEALGEAAGARSVGLQIVNLREDLGRWYRSLGYREVGTAPYTHRPVKQPCHFIEMRKLLSPVVIEHTGASATAA
jgi:ribosomal protein S18 acetylase RimI-like enzyme